MTRQRVIQFEYQQALVQESDHPGWSESLEISVRVLAAAIYSGWYSENFGSRGNDFVVLMAIAIHARPLLGEDLRLLVGLGMANPQDEGRLYARVSDKGLAAELGMSRDTIARSAERLRDLHAIDILEVPEDLVAFRDSHGQFNGSKVYLLAGDIQNRFLAKDVLIRAAKTSTVDTDLMLRAAKSGTVETGSTHGAANSGTVDPALAPRDAKSGTVSVENEAESTLEMPDRAANYPTADLHRAANSGTNIEDEEEEEEGASPVFAQVLACFASRKGDPDYRPTPKEQTALSKLLADGFSFEQIVAGIDLAFSRPAKPRHFTHCAAIARDLARYQQESLPLETRTQPEAQPAAALRQSEEPEAAPLVIDAHLSRAVEVLRAAEREITPDLLARLRMMAARCQAAAQATGSAGGDWLADALVSALGVAKPGNLLNYAEAVLSDWIQNGRPDRQRPTPANPQPRARRRSEPGVNQGIRDYLKKHGGISYDPNTNGPA